MGSIANVGSDVFQITGLTLLKKEKRVNKYIMTTLPEENTEDRMYGCKRLMEPGNPH